MTVWKTGVIYPAQYVCVCIYIFVSLPVVVVFYLSDMGETVTYLSQNTKEWCADDSPGHRWPLGH